MGSWSKTKLSDTVSPPIKLPAVDPFRGRNEQDELTLPEIATRAYTNTGITHKQQLAARSYLHFRLVTQYGAADVRRRLCDVDSDDEANGDGNTDDDDDDDAADKRTARLFLKCAAAIELLAVQARAYEQALRDA